MKKSLKKKNLQYWIYKLMSKRNNNKIRRVTKMLISKFLVLKRNKNKLLKRNRMIQEKMMMTSHKIKLHNLRKVNQSKKNRNKNKMLIRMQINLLSQLKRIKRNWKSFKNIFNSKMKNKEKLLWKCLEQNKWNIEERRMNKKKNRR